MSLIVVEYLETWPCSAQLARSLVSMFRQGMNGWRRRSKSTQVVNINYTITTSRILYRPSFVADGNFKLQHLAMRRPDDDVFLCDGQGHMVGREPYWTHIKHTTEHFQVRCIFNYEHRNSHISISIRDPAAAIIERSMAGMRIAKIAIPPEWVDVHVRVMGPMFHIAWLIFRRAKGGCDNSDQINPQLTCCCPCRQMNIDYAVCQALNYIDGSEAALFIYDVCCQWVVHFKERVSRGEFLSLWEHFQLTPAIGKFHLGAHIKECFHKFSLNFIRGTGQIDGEIMEALWFILDKVSGITRSMSWAHRQEMLDDYMDDGNFKKFVRSGESQSGSSPGNIVTIIQWHHW